MDKNEKLNIQIKKKKAHNLALVKLGNSTIHLPVKPTSFELHEL